DVVARADTEPGEVVREPGRALVGLRVGEPAVAAHHGLVLGDRVDDALPQVGEVELQRPSIPSAQKKSVPPSTGTVAPTTKLQSSEQRNTTILATSSAR